MFGSCGSLYGGTNMRAPRLPIWCMSWVICGLYSRWMSMASRVSFCGEHEPVAVVVVTGIALVEVRIDPVEPGVLGGVPVIDHQDLAVRVLRRHHQHDGVVEDLSNLRRVLRRQPVRDADDRLAVADLRRMDRRVEEVEGNPLPREHPRLVLGQPARVGQPVVDLDQPVEPLQVLLRAELHEHVRIAVRGRPAVLVLHPVGAIRQELQVLEHLWIPRQVAVGADLEPEVLRRRRDRLGVRRGGEHEEKRNDREQAGRHLELSCGVESRRRMSKAGYHAGNGRPEPVGRPIGTGSRAAGAGRRRDDSTAGRRPIP